MSTKVTFEVEGDMRESELRLLLCDALYEFTRGPRGDAVEYAEKKAVAYVGYNHPEWEATVEEFRKSAERRVALAELLRESVIETFKSTKETYV